MGYAVAAGGRDMTGHRAIERLLKHPPGWPLLEALASTAAALFLLTAVMDLWATLSSALATCLPT